MMSPVHLLVVWPLVGGLVALAVLAGPLLLLLWWFFAGLTASGGGKR